MNPSATTKLRIAAAALLLAGLLASAGYAAPMNLTGTWSPKYWTLILSLHQEGDRVWGTGGMKDFWFRGHWEGQRLVLVANKFEPARKGACKSYGVFVLSGTALSNLNTLWVREGDRPLRGPWTRQSPNAGAAIDYPYAAELDLCGYLRTYELSFATASDQLQGADWPILAAVADLMKKNGSMKIQVTGHTDSTGDAKKNMELSQRRADTVKKALVEKYGAEAGRIDAKGWGVEQPVQDNQTEDGRALNRRVEIMLVR